MGLKEVFSKVSAIEPQVTELASHKVELGLADDIVKMVNDIVKESTNANNLSKKVIAAIDLVLASYRQNEVKSNEALKSIDTLKTQAKNLGLDLPPVLSQYETNLNNLLKDSRAKMTAAQNAKKQF